MALSGGKSYLAKRIIALMPPHTHYAEPYFGGGAVLFAKDPEGISETINDINNELMNFWEVLQQPFMFNQVVNWLNVTPLSDTIFRDAKSLNISVSNEMQRAYAFFIRYRQSRQALGKDYVTPTRRTRRGMNEQVSAWLSAVEGLPEAHERLIRVELRNMDACNFIRKYDHENCLFYCDPPYLHETRTATNAYEYEMTIKQHSNLLECLQDIKGKFIVSGYESKMYSSFAWRANWSRVEIAIDNKASSATTKPIKTECLWMNFNTTLPFKELKS